MNGRIADSAAHPESATLGICSGQGAKLSANVQIEHRPESNCFAVESDGSTAELSYERDAQRLVLTHTEVPDQMRGRGIGGALVREALEYASADGLVIAPECSYASKWLKKHLDAASTVAIDWSSAPVDDGESSESN